MKVKTTIIVLAALVFGLAVYWGVNYLPDKLDEITDSLTGTPEPLDENEIEEIMARVPEETEDDVTELFPDDMSESQVMDAIHSMTHQKVHASEKWGKLQISEERIKRLLEVVRANDYEHKEFYLEALEEWEVGRFNNAVQVHNFIWNLKGGTIGKAERLLSIEEEARFIKNNFK